MRRRPIISVTLTVFLASFVMLAVATSVPAAPARAAPAAGIGASPAFQDTITYVVRRGDTLYRIAARFGVPVATIVRLNHISNPNRIYVGQRLRIPITTPTPGPRPAEEISIDAPVINALITSPVTVRGYGTGFEATLGVRVIDGSGTTIGEGTAMITGQAAIWTGPFSGVVSYSAPSTADGLIQVFNTDMQSGAISHLASVHVRFSEGATSAR